MLTETELLDFVVTVVRGGSGLPDYITARLQDPQTAFLFIGFCFFVFFTSASSEGMVSFMESPFACALIICCNNAPGRYPSI